TCGRPPRVLQQHGAEPQPSLVHDPATAPLVRRAFEMVASGIRRGEARRLVHALGLRGQGGGEISVQTFHYLLRNHAYRGWIKSERWEGSGYRGDFQPIVDETLFWIVQKRLTPASPLRTEYRRDHPDFPLRGVIRCGQCNGVLTASNTVKKRSARVFPYYHCARKGCMGVRVRKYVLEETFGKLLADVTPKPEYLPLFRQIVLDVWKSRRESVTTLRAELRRRVNELMEKKDRIYDQYDGRKIDDETYRRQSDRADARQGW
ncbi:MAG: recombinase family protein, partial [Holophagales bacterium]|nr:recombinase family protein [Holophagales bacterium]